MHCLPWLWSRLIHLLFTRNVQSCLNLKHANPAYLLYFGGLVGLVWLELGVDTKEAAAWIWLVYLVGEEVNCGEEHCSILSCFGLLTDALCFTTCGCLWVFSLCDAFEQGVFMRQLSHGEKELSD